MRKSYSVILKALLSGVLCMVSLGALNAQLALTRSYFPSSFTTIVGLPGTTTSTATGDDGLQAGIAIGFTFNYLGTNYTSVDVNTNGAMAFAGSGLLGTTRDNQNLYTNTAPNGVISAWWDDLTVDVGGGIYTQLSGVVGSQVFTVEWSTLSFYTGATQRIQFQVKLYEGTNRIEFIYGPRSNGTASASESASIGCESNTGGPGNFLDVVTGSATVGNYYLNAATGWPTRNYRLTPGAPTALAGGAYTAGSTGTYPNLSEVVADINHRGIAGPIVVTLTDALYNIAPAGGDNWFPIVFAPVAGSSSINTILVQPASGTSTISYDGYGTGALANTASNAITGTANEPIVAVVGTDYLGLNNLNLTATAGTAQVDRGLLVINDGAINGAQFNGFNNITVSLNRTNVSSIGIQQNTITAATSAAGANSSNAYMNLNIQNVYAGIYLLGTAAFPDLACQIGTTVATNFNTIGGTTANDIGGSTTQAYGIRTGNQSGGSIFNNNVQNVGGSAIATDGILVELSQGTTSVFRNNVSNIRALSTSSTVAIQGIRANVATTTGHSLRVYNNSVCAITSAYTGAATATKQLKGIYVQSAGGGLTTSNINVDNNSVYLDGSSSPNISSVCYEIGTTSGPVINCRNNIFVNGTASQTAPAGHWGMRSTSATLTGNVGSVSNNNDVYIATTATQGFFGQGNTTDYATLANWQAAMVGQDAASLSADPLYVNPTTCNLHASGAAVNNVASVIAWVTDDIDNQTRSVSTPDIGFDEFAPTTLDVGATTLVLPTVGACYSAAEPVTIRIRNWSANTINFATNNVAVTVNVTGAVTATLNATVNTGTLASSASQDVAMGTLNMSAAGTYTFNATATTVGDQNTGNDAMVAANRVFSAGTALATPGTVCAGDSSSLTLSGQNGTSFVWQISTDGGTTWTNTSGITSPYRVAPSDTSWYRALVCGLITSVADTVLWIDTAPPIAIGDTICGIDTAHLAASGGGTIQWYDQPTGGTVLATGSTYNPIPAGTTTYYVGAVRGSQSGIHTTTYAAGNGANGNVFAIKALSSITITGFDGHCSSTAGTSTNWEIWYRPDDYLLTPGSQNSNVGWTQLGAVTGVISAGPGVPTVIPISINLPMPANAKWSFMVCATSGSVSYTNGTTTGNLYNANADLEVYQGHGGALFALPNNPRVFNGRIKYNKGCPTPRTPVTVLVNPADSIALTASSMISCSGDTVALAATSVNTGYSYSWSPSGTLSSSTGSNVNAGPTATTTYTVTGLDSIGCRSVADVTVTWIAKPVVTAMVIPDTICANDSIALSSSVSPINFQVGTGTIANTSTSYPSPFGNFYWGSRHQMLILASELIGQNLGAGYLNSISFDVTNLNGANPHENFEIKLALTNVTAVTAFQTPTFTSVYTNPSFLPATGVSPIMFSVPFFWDGVSNLLVEVCHNNSAYLNNISVNQSTTPFVSTVWYRADAAGVCSNTTVTSSQNQRPNMYFSMMGTYSYDWTPNANLATPNASSTVGIATASTDFILMVTDSVSGCVGVDTASVFAYPVPVVNLGNDGYFCGTDATLDAGNPGSTFVWSTADSTQTIFVNASGTYSVDVTDTIGCKASDTVAITFTPFPVVNLGADTSGCQGASFTLDAGHPGSSYLWSTLDSSQTIVVNATGSYSVQLTDSFGCPGADTVNVTINALPNVTFTSTLDTLCTFSGPVTLTGGSPSGGAYTGTGVTSGSFNPATAGAGSHTITYTFTDGNGCTGTATHVIIVEVCPGIADGMNNLRVGLYPNPNDGRFTFTVPVNVATEVSYQVADARGVVVLSERSSQPSGLYKQEINLANFATGVYSLRVTIDGITSYKRIVVQR